MAATTGIVKGVLSGDTLLLMPSANSPAEKTLTFASLNAPRLGRKAGDAEEPFAFVSREILRKKCIGKVVTFRIDYFNQSGPNNTRRDYGTVMLEGENLAVFQVQQGLAKVKNARPDDSQVSRDYEQLKAAEEQAKSKGLGVWNDRLEVAAATVRSVHYSTEEAAKFFNSTKGKKQQVIVERFDNGARMHVLGALDGTYFQFPLHLSGVQCPAQRRVPVATPAPVAAGGAAASSSAAAPAATPVQVIDEPFAVEARVFSEARLLGREISIVLESIDAKNNIFGSIVSANPAAKSFGEELLSQGLGRFQEWSAAKSALLPKLRAAEKEAKDKNLRLWKDYVAPVSSLASSSSSADSIPRSFAASVVEVISGDTLAVLDSSSGSEIERRISLASIAAPRIGNIKAGSAPEAFALDAKEYLRQLLIGKQVEISLDYARTPGAGAGGAGASSAPAPAPSSSSASQDQKRFFCTVLLFETAYGKTTKVDVGERMISQGFASVIRHRADEERSSNYDQLVLAENAAKKASKGIFAGGAAGAASSSSSAGGKKASAAAADPHHVNDLSSDASKAKQLLPFLTSGGRQKALVEAVLSGSRFRVLVPKQHCLLTLSLSAVVTPSMGRAIGASKEPFADESTLYARKNILQREVEIEVETLDKSGAFVGTLYVNKLNFGAQLLKEGLGRLIKNGATERTPYFTDFRRAEEDAKTSARKIWSLSEADLESVGGSRKSLLQKKPVVEVVSKATRTLSLPSPAAAAAAFKAVVTGISDSSTLLLRPCASSSASSVDEAELAGMLQDMSLAQASPSAPLTLPRVNDIILAKFSADNQWYRARVHAQNVKGDSVQVYYVDYGNSEQVSRVNTRLMDDRSPVSITAVPAQCVEAKLAFIRALDQIKGAAENIDEEVLDDAYAFVADLNGLEVTVKPEYTAAPSTLYASILNESNQSVSMELIRNGLAAVDSEVSKLLPALSGAVARMQEEENKARRAHTGAWRLGDFESDE